MCLRLSCMFYSCFINSRSHHCVNYQVPHTLSIITSWVRRAWESLDSCCSIADVLCFKHKSYHYSTMSPQKTQVIWHTMYVCSAKYVCVLWCKSWESIVHPPQWYGNPQVAISHSHWHTHTQLFMGCLQIPICDVYINSSTYTPYNIYIYLLYIYYIYNVYMSLMHFQSTFSTQ